MPGEYDLTYSEWLAAEGLVHGPATQSAYLDWLAQEPASGAIAMTEPGVKEYVTAAGEVLVETGESLGRLVVRAGEAAAEAIPEVRETFEVIVIGAAIVLGIVILTR